MSPNAGLHLIGGMLIASGVITIGLGDQVACDHERKMLRWFSHPRGRMRWLKGPMGAGMIYAGIELLLP